MSTARTTSAHITPDESRQLKSRCLADLREALPRYESRLKEISPLLWTYALDVVREDIDIHNEMELLGFRKFLRILDTYPINIKKVQHVYSVFDYMTFDGLNGRKHYPMTPIQAYILAAIFGPMRSREQQIRLVTDAVLYVVRKFAKTTLAGFIAFYFLMYEDANAEVYCCANSANQSKILFKMAAGFVRQVDPLGKRIRQTATICEWRNGYDRSAKIESLTASAKAKDGAFAQLVCADEYGSAPYINEKSDMANLVQVMESSMGPRLEPLTLTTTTAGRISDGPFRNKLTVMEQTLRNEMNIELDGEPHTTDQDWQFALIFQPDLWERDVETLRQPRLARKVNPHLGVTVQAEYYEREWKKMVLDVEVMKENLCKLYNIYQSDKSRDWLTAEQIQRLQRNVRIEDCRGEDGWSVFVGLDFSMGDDLNAMSFLAWRINPVTGREEMVADMRAYMTRRAVLRSTFRRLLEAFEREGWLIVVEEETLEPEVVVNELIMLYENGVTFALFGYDPYKAKSPINAIKAWIYSEGGDMNQMVVPVRQNFATYNPLVEEMDFLIKSREQLLVFSLNPMWAWEFGNCVLMESNDGMENLKPVKGSNVDAKVDNVQCLLSALHVFDLMHTKEE